MRIPQRLWKVFTTYIVSSIFALLTHAFYLSSFRACEHSLQGHFTAVIRNERGSSFSLRSTWLCQNAVWFLSTLTQLSHSLVSQSSRHIQTQINVLAQQTFRKANHLSHFLTSNVVSHLQIQSEILSWLEFFFKSRTMVINTKTFSKNETLSKSIITKNNVKDYFQKIIKNSFIKTL